MAIDEHLYVRPRSTNVGEIVER